MEEDQQAVEAYLVLRATGLKGLPLFPLWSVWIHQEEVGAFPVAESDALELDYLYAQGGFLVGRSPGSIRSGWQPQLG